MDAATTYYVRAYATNSVGTAYGNDVSFSTLGEAPESLTQPATGISTSGATLNGTVIAHDLSTTVTFEYGTSTSYGSTATAIQSPVVGNTITNVNVSITGLKAGTIYHFRVKTENSLGITFGNDLMFETSADIPRLTTTSVSSKTTTTAQAGGNIISDGGATIIALGVCWSITTEPTINDSKTSGEGSLGAFSNDIINLIPNTTYYLRAYATNGVGTAYGEELTFRTYAVMDVDDNGYYSITIGTQTWLTENLKTTKFNDGTAIPLATDGDSWSSLYFPYSPGYCWYNNDATTYKNVYGALYNASAVYNGELCPIGWHVSYGSDLFNMLEVVDPDVDCEPS